MARSTTLKDVAEVAGVSTATVARVLHDNGYVAEETRARVERALAETGYRLNKVARGLRTRRSFLLGHLLHAITENPFFAQVALGVEQEALRRGYHVLLYNLQGRAERERAGVEALIERRVDAIVFTTAMRAEHVALATDAGIPVVQVERVTPARSHAVVVNNYVGARGDGRAPRRRWAKRSAQSAPTGWWWRCRGTAGRSRRSTWRPSSTTTGRASSRRRWEP